MKNSAQKLIRYALCLCAAALLLGVYGESTEEARGYFTTVELTGTASGSALEVRYPSGETAASLPLDMAQANFPGRESAAAVTEGEKTALSVFYGRGGAGLCWAVFAVGPPRVPRTPTSSCPRTAEKPGPWPPPPKTAPMIW